MIDGHAAPARSQSRLVAVRGSVLDIALADGRLPELDEAVVLHSDVPILA